MKLRLSTFFLALLCLAPFARAQQGNVVPVGATPNVQGVTATNLWYFDAAVPGDFPSIAPHWVQVKGAAGGGGTTTPGASGTALTLTLTSATSNGTVTAGSRSLVFVFSPDFTGTVQSATFTGANDSSFTPPIPAGCTLGAVTYTVTAGTVRISDAR